MKYRPMRFLIGFSASFALENEEMFHVKQFWDVVVVGGGHAGIEAALASAKMGCETLLVTLDADKIGEMSCNPSIGGVGKGQLVKEIDALGGEMGRNADWTGIQFKRLNTRKGSAVQSSRCQSDKKKYAERMRSVIGEQPHLHVLQTEVKALRVENGQIVGLSLGGQDVAAKAVVITAGTFMKGLMHCGDLKADGGRFGEGASRGLSDTLRELGLTINRLKTGTPPRLLRDSIDWSQMDVQPGDKVPVKFSFFGSEIALPQVVCHLTYTNPETHRTIRENLARSPLYSGQIKGVGPRYCPSIEDKVVKFPDKERHPLFFEPEALDSDWIYPNGISTSLPQDVQESFVRTLPGCREVVFARHGYAVEYDCIDPRQLHRTLESKIVKGLYLAGQVNGTSGYEEAAAQGLLAGINAGLKVQGRAPLILGREQAYIGVMIDDLTRLGVNEPYRMFTSRAEYRLSLREDNADLRLSRLGHEVGVLTRSDYDQVVRREKELAVWTEWLGANYVQPSSRLNEKLAALGSSPLSGGQSLLQLLRRPETSLADILTFTDKTVPLPFPEPTTLETLEVEVKYEGYIQLQKDEIARLYRLREEIIPPELDYQKVASLSIELREKLGRARPHSLAEAATISGVTPAALSSLLFFIRKGERASGNPL